MATRPLLFLLLATVTLSCCSSAADGARSTPTVPAGGWQPVKDVNDPRIRGVAEFAVAEHDKASRQKLVFVRVLGGDTQVVAGLNYRLTVEAKDGGVARAYEAIVWEKPWEKFRKLTSFKLKA